LLLNDFIDINWARSDDTGDRQFCGKFLTVGAVSIHVKSSSNLGYDIVTDLKQFMEHILPTSPHVS